MSERNEQRLIFFAAAKLVGFAVLMFVFCLKVLPPLYTLFCEVTGLNGKTSSTPYLSAVAAEVDTSRVVNVKFIASNNEDMPWQFKPATYSMKVHPGQAVETHFVAVNPTDKKMMGQAVPSMAPKNATDYFLKTECFCFNQQTLEPQERAELGLQFIVDQDLPKAVKTITLSYTLFDVSAMLPKKSEREHEPTALKQKDTHIGLSSIYDEKYVLDTRNIH